MLLPNQVSNVEMAVRHARNSVLFVILCFMFQTARKIYVPMFIVFSLVATQSSNFTNPLTSLSLSGDYLPYVGYNTEVIHTYFQLTHVSHI